ncbi:MAG: NAD(P)-binding domain-containing protein, partial [Alcaligenaceae bacterium]|nr:NAD(P)-binding domain-containing protein [Alcaligenaceae bacterium]
MTSTAFHTIGFIGIGHMGGPMAACLHRAGHALVLMDADTQAALKLCSDLGDRAKVAASGAELAAQCDAVITMLPTSAIVRSV